MRELTSHKVNGVDDGLRITVRDDPGPDDANYHYFIEGAGENFPGVIYPSDVKFQNGSIREAGVNGVTHEALLAILIDRLEGFQRGKLACRDNEMALSHLRAAQERLLSRTRERAARGVEGTLQA